MGFGVLGVTSCLTLVGFLILLVGMGGVGDLLLLLLLVLLGGRMGLCFVFVGGMG